MADILVRNIDDAVKTVLRQRARDHGRSLAEEVRQILSKAALEGRKEAGLGTRIRQLFEGLEPGPDPDIREIRGMKMQIPDFNE